MRITINVTDKEIDHICSHVFYDCCSEVESIMLKVQRKVNKGRK